jgi:hypothetical protein
MATEFPAEIQRGMPKWRDKQRKLPLAEKIRRMGCLIQETRRTEALKRACKKSAKPSKSLSLPAS